MLRWAYSIKHFDVLMRDWEQYSQNCHYLFGRSAYHMSDQDSLGKLLEAKEPFKNEPKTIVRCLVNTWYISLVRLSMPSTFNQPNR